MDIQGPLLGQAPVCEPILRALPGWFGIEAALQNYVNQIGGLPTFLAAEAGRAVGFLTLKPHTPHAAEIYVMAVSAGWHRRGIGRALFERAVESLRGTGVEYLQVKTLGPSHPDAGYARTRAFYEAVGFRALEEIPQIWGADSPCLLMVKYIGAG
jgi:GNAT superfamily N-acetyltransferase